MLLAASIIGLLVVVIAWCALTVPPASWAEQRERRER
jgi:hypothetical protein